MNFRTHILIIISAIILPTFSFSQDQDDILINDQIWLDYYQAYYIKEKVEFYGDASWRYLVTDGSRMEIYGRASLSTGQYYQLTSSKQY